MTSPELRRETLLDCFADVGVEGVLASLDTETIDQITENLWRGIQAEEEYAAPIARGADPRDREIARLKMIIQDLQPQVDAARMYRERVADLRCTTAERIVIGSDGIQEIRY